MVVGTLEADTDYNVYIENANTGYIVNIEATSDGDGLLTVDLEDLDASFFSPNHKYKLTVTPNPGSSTDIQDITMPDDADTVVNCLLLIFTKSFTSEGEIVTQESAILELDLSCDCE